MLRAFKRAITHVDCLYTTEAMKPNTNRAAILNLHKENLSQAEIARRLLLPRSTVSRAIKRFNELGTDADRNGRGRKRTVRTSNNKKVIRERIR